LATSVARAKVNNRLEENMADQTSVIAGRKKSTTRSLHTLGVLTGFAGGVWMGAAEAPTKFVAAGFSPVLLSLAMVFGVFTGRWTIPALLKGSEYIIHDLREKTPYHLGFTGRCAMGSCEYVGHGRRPGCGSVNRISSVEYRQFGGALVGMAFLS
jgi:hypothetical protein